MANFASGAEADRARGAGRALVRIFAVLLLGAMAPAAALDDATAAAALDFAHQRLTATASKVVPPATPEAARASGAWTTVASADALGWTQGFAPGLYWSMYEATGDPAWRERAEAATWALEVQKTNTQSHDLGFKMVPSFVRAFQLTGDTAARDVALAAARSLATRWRDVPGIIVCCDWNPAWERPLVIDTMMNLELLLWGARNGGDASWADLALSHARTTARDLVRADGSTFHVADYDATTGALRFRGTFQGASDDSTWSRGQAWAIYGYTTAYRYTRAPDMLAVARKTAGYWLSHVGPGGVPNWDFDSTELHADSSSAAAAASALLELAGYVEEPEASRYREAAGTALDTLASDAYLAKGTSYPSILRRAVGNYPAGSEIDVGLVYGDHYFLEAVFRRVPHPRLRWTAESDFAAALHDLGTGNAGVRTIEYDVTPRASPIDGVVGWGDSSRTVAAYDDLAMLVRMSPAGVFEVQNADEYVADARVPYAGGATYHVRVVADLAAKRYSAWVRPPGGDEIRLAASYAFRTTAADAGDVGKVAVKAAISDGDFHVENHRVAAGTVVVGATPVDSSHPQTHGGAFVGCFSGGGGGTAVVVVSAVIGRMRLRRGRC
jgi:unsaturated chondroitin disaccharide hydrolase